MDFPFLQSCCLNHLPIFNDFIDFFWLIKFLHILRLLNHLVITISSIFSQLFIFLLLVKCIHLLLYFWCFCVLFKKYFPLLRSWISSVLCSKICVVLSSTQTEFCFVGEGRYPGSFFPLASWKVIFINWLNMPFLSSMKCSYLHESISGLSYSIDQFAHISVTHCLNY